jgi:hypothetical protein
VNDKLERIWKDATVAYFEVLSRQLPEMIGENREKKTQSPGSDWRQGLPEHESVVLTTKL